jgi:hypothetical protein
MEVPSMDRKHTKLGIASFTLTLLTGFFTFAFLLAAAVLSNVHRIDPDARRIGQFLAFLCFVAILTANLTALGLGIAGLAQADRKKLFAILGTTFAALQLLVALVVVLANA